MIDLQQRDGDFGLALSLTLVGAWRTFPSETATGFSRRNPHAGSRRQRPPCS